MSAPPAVGSVPNPDDAVRAGPRYRIANLDCIESNTVLFDSRDEPNTALFRPDGRHFNPAAYAEFTKLIKPILLQAYHSLSTHN